MLSDPEVEIAAAIVIGLEIAGPFKGQSRLGRRGEIGGSPEQPRQAAQALERINSGSVL